MQNNEVKVGMRVKWQDVTKVRHGLVQALGGFTIGRGVAGQDVIILPDQPTEQEIRRSGKFITIAGMLSPG